uniref:Putative secreted protein n=1 Tax=Amblyomma triste TaxID=251400 RepID=A0A023G0Y1_AMBTT
MFFVPLSAIFSLASGCCLKGKLLPLHRLHISSFSLHHSVWKNCFISIILVYQPVMFISLVSSSGVWHHIKFR